jgi:DNA polymerase elongation subunit (family B)
LSNFYTNVALSGKFVLLRGVENGKRIRRKVEYKPTFYVPSKDPSPFTTLSGEWVQPISPGNIQDSREFINTYKEVDNFKIYGNTRHEYAFIADEYPEDIHWDASQIVIAYIDIEVGSENGFPEPKNASEQITAITVKFNDKYFVFAYAGYKKHREDVFYIKCEDEASLITKFLDFWTRFYPDIVTGWNVKSFDIPYLVNRIKNLFGEQEANKMSPWNKLSEREYHISAKRTVQTYEIYGVATLDYLELYKKFTYSQQENYRLDNIAHVELGEKKIDYSEYDSLHELYKLDYQKFIEYNVKDVELVFKLEDKMKLIELALTLSYDNKVNYDDVFAQVRMWDAIIFNHLKKKNIVIPQMKDSAKKESFEGAYVKDPIVGMHNWVASFDLNSLYPHLIMQYNMSMETFVEPIEYSHQMRELISSGVNVDSLLNKKIDTDFLKQHSVCLTPNGQFFRTDKTGLLAEIMESMYVDRSRYKKLAIEAKKKIELVQGDPVQVEYLEKEIARYNNLQMAKKVSLNSAYGAVGNSYFRFFDVRIAEAITLAGQLSIRWIENKLNAYMSKLVQKEQDYVIASDTDSIYLNLAPLVDKFVPKGKPTSEVIKLMDKICEDKIQPFIDKSYQELADYINAHSQKMQMKRESLADKAIWTAKKRYILNVYNNEGVEYAKPKLKIMGLEAVKSSTPSACRAKIKEAINIVMSGTESDLISFIDKFKVEFKTLQIQDISFPRSVNGLREYKDSLNIFKKGTPIHVKGALVFNHHLVQRNLTKNYQEIKEGDKIKFFYLKQPNHFHNNTLAFISTIPKELDYEKYIDYDVQFEKSFIEPLKIILDSIDWKHQYIDTLEDMFG